MARVTLSLLGAELFAVEWEPTRPEPAKGLDEDGAPKVHETNTAGSCELGFQTASPWRHTSEGGDD